MDTSRKYDLIIFGASGFTGKFVVENLGKLLKTQKVAPLSWAIAGRQTSKLQKVLKDASDESGYDMTSIDIIEVDIKSPQSLLVMAKLGSVIINCVGPYRFYGEPAVKACIEGGASMVDISGEPQYLESMYLLYNKKAEAKDVYIVGACAFDCIPTDMGVAYLKQKFQGDLNSVEMYLEFDPKFKNTVIHYGTWESAILFLGNAKELKKIRKELFKTPLPKPKYKVHAKRFMHYNEDVRGWGIQYLGSDREVVQRSEKFFYETEKSRPVQIQTYAKEENIIYCFLMYLGVVILGFLAKFSYTLDLLLTYPKLITAGRVSHEGPTREQAEVPFTFTLVGKGWSEKLAEKSDQHVTPPNKKTILRVEGTNPAYGATCICVIQSALTILREREKLPSKGGVYTTAAAFSKTTLVERLNDTGLTFAIEQ